MTISIDIEIRNIEVKIEKLQQKLEILQQAKSILEDPTDDVDNNIIIVEKQKIKQSNSIGSLLIELLEERKTPLHVKDIKKQFEKLGKETTIATITGICARLRKAGVLKKTYPNTFDLVKINKKL